MLLKDIFEAIIPELHRYASHSGTVHSVNGLNGSIAAPVAEVARKPKSQRGDLLVCPKKQSGGEALVTKAKRANWLDKIQASASAVAKQLGWETVRFILNEYGDGASSIETLKPSYYESAWNELFDIEREMKD